MQSTEHDVTESDKASPLLDEWLQDTFCMQIKQLCEGKYFNICSIDNLIHGLNLVRNTQGLPAIDQNQIPEYGALRALHCVHFDSMAPAVRVGIPTASLRVLGLDETTGSAFFGEAKWSDVMTHFGQLKAVHPDLLPVEQNVETSLEQSDSEPVNIDKRDKLLAVGFFGLLLIAASGFSNQFIYETPYTYVCVALGCIIYIASTFCLYRQCRNSRKVYVDEETTNDKVFMKLEDDT